VVNIEDRAVREEVAAFKRKMDGCLSDADEGVSPEVKKIPR
jgi:hypothetical protein